MSEKSGNKSSISVPEAAAVLGVTPQFLRLGLQQEKFPFGVAVKMRRWAYYINPVEFWKYIGEEAEAAQPQPKNDRSNGN